jgi:hypothetical protein
MNKNTYLNTIPWRADYEPFRGWGHSKGLYRIQAERTAFVAYHADQRIFTSASLYEAQLACENRLDGGHLTSKA